MSKIKIRSSAGHLIVSYPDGKVLKNTLDFESYPDKTRPLNIDWDEQQEDGVTDLKPLLNNMKDSIDILDVGYSTPSGYEPACEEWREEILEMRVNP